MWIDMPKAYIGIDPGKKGAISSISPAGALVWAMPDDVVGVADLLTNLATRREVFQIYAGIEKAQAMPKQGVASMFTFGMGYGVLQGVLASCQIPYEIVHPRKWQKAVFDSGDAKEDTKTRSLMLARRLFPELDLKRKGDHGKADALLIALWLKRRHEGNGNYR